MSRHERGLGNRTRLICAVIASLYLFTSSSINLFHVCPSSRNADARCAAGHHHGHACDAPAPSPDRSRRGSARWTPADTPPAPTGHGACPACLFNSTNLASKVVATARTFRASPVHHRVLVNESVRREDRRVHPARPRAPPPPSSRPV